MSGKFKLFLIFFTLSLFFWWGTNVFAGKMENFFFWKEISKHPEVFTAQLVLENKFEELKPFLRKDADSLDFGAKSAISVLVKGDGSSKTLFEKEKNEKLPIASLTKLMTALVVLNNYDSSATIEISKDAALQDDEYGQGYLKIGEKFSAKDLLYILLMESSNGAAVAFADFLGELQFVSLMNKTAADLNLENTFFVNPSGLDPDNLSDITNYSTSEDLAKLGNYLLAAQPLVWEIAKNSEFNLYLPDGVFFKQLKNTNELLKEFPQVGGKTGWTPEAQGCLLLIYKAPNEDGYLINVVLGSQDRFEDMKKLISWTKESYKW